MTLTALGCSSAAAPSSAGTASATGAAGSSSASATPSTSSPGIAGWKQVWGDEFGGPADSSINTADWQFLDGQGTALFGNTGEIETTTSSLKNIHLDGHGDLDIVVLGHGAAGSSGTQWTSARIKSTGLFGAPAGGEMMVTASIKQPITGNGLGYWPAFWMLGPGTWPATGEIDIMEDVDGISNTSATVHCGNLTQRNSDGTLGPCHETTGISSGLLPCPTCQTAFHTYSVIVDRRDAADQQIRWYLDGKEIYSVREQQVGAAVWDAAFDHGLQIILDVAVGGSFPDKRCDCTTPTVQTTSSGTMAVQYVRVYTN
jgi:beta-glucanase (GH16 family)